jgi:hypothetical protein
VRLVTRVLFVRSTSRLARGTRAVRGSRRGAAETSVDFSAAIVNEVGSVTKDCYANSSEAWKFLRTHLEHRVEGRLGGAPEVAEPGLKGDVT